MPTMGRPTSAEPAKGSKRKGTRSVSTLTPSQLARKRANDREAQRAIRARTKEHIDRLEQELEALKGIHGRDKTVQDLLRRNKALEDELNRIKETNGISVTSITSSPYSASAGMTSPRGCLGGDAACFQQDLSRIVRQLTPTSPAYDDNLSAGSGAIPSPRMSPLPSAGDYTCMPEYPQQYVPMPSSCDAWATASNVSSPSSSSLNNDDFGNQAYIPTSMPNSMMPSGRNAGGFDGKEVKLEYDDMDANAARFRLGNDMSMQMASNYMQQPQQQSQQWSMYPMYYQGQMGQRGPNADGLTG